MIVEPLALPEVLLLKPRVFADHRGYFLETFSERSWAQAGLRERFVQDNLSSSVRGTLRGLHLQNPNAQGKLVTAVSGVIWDVAVDLRVGSPTFGRWVAAELSEDNHHQLYVPEGFGHGFCALSDTARVVYKCTALYDPSSELSVRYDDPELGIAWPVASPLLAPKDAAAPSLAELTRAGRLPEYAPHLVGELV
jgi:dTDP-4-dehydrorhamnose 3,5-epimerase